MKPSTRILLVGLALALVLIAGGVWAYAETDGGIIYACVKNSSGSIRIVSSPDKCELKKEEPLSWSIVGPTGPTGPQGVLGFYSISTGWTQISIDEKKGIEALCSAGDQSTGGGFILEDHDDCIQVLASYANDQDRWRVLVQNNCSSVVYSKAHARCADMTP